MMATKVKKRHPVLKVIAWVVGVLILLLSTAAVGSFFIDKPLRKYMEAEINRNLKGYTARLEGAHFQPIGLDLTLKGVSIIQNANPTPPVAAFPKFEASLHWRPLIHGRIVGELYLEKPQLHIDLRQFSHEAAKKFPVKEEGWQKALQAIYPLKINHISIKDGDITYIDTDPNRPLHITSLNARTTNIRNIESPDKTYPSPIHLDGVIFGKGSMTMDGDANFLEEPFAGVRVTYKLSNVPLDNFKPELQRKNLQIKGGVIASDGLLEYSPNIKTADVRDLTISGVHLDYVHSPETAGAESARVEAVKEAAAEAKNKPGLLTKVERLKVDGSEFGYVNTAGRAPYRAFITNVSLEVTNLSNHFSQGPAHVQLAGRFMGSGPTTATATFRPEESGSDFDLKFAVNDAQLQSMNDILLSYGNFDVVGGLFTMYSEVHVKNGEISGYIKPFFKDIHVYDKRKEKEKSLFHKLYVRIVGLAASILQNPSQGSVATEVTIGGPASQPKTSTWQIIKNLVKHAFFHAFLPEFDKEVTKETGKKPQP